MRRGEVIGRGTFIRSVALPSCSRCAPLWRRRAGKTGRRARDTSLVTAAGTGLLVPAPSSLGIKGGFFVVGVCVCVFGPSFHLAWWCWLVGAWVGCCGGWSENSILVFLLFFFVPFLFFVFCFVFVFEGVGCCFVIEDLG